MYENDSLLPDCYGTLKELSKHNKSIDEVELRKQNIIRVNNWKDIGKTLLDNEE